MAVKKIGVSFLLCAFSLWVSPTVAAALCEELVALTHEHGHGRVHAEESSHHSEGTPDCCQKIYAGGPDAVILSAAPDIQPASSGKAAPWIQHPALLLPARVAAPWLLSTLHKPPAPSPQRPLYALYSAYLI